MVSDTAAPVLKATSSRMQPTTTEKMSNMKSRLAAHKKIVEHSPPNVPFTGVSKGAVERQMSFEINNKSQEMEAPRDLKEILNSKEQRVASLPSFPQTTSDPEIDAEPIEPKPRVTKRKRADVEQTSFDDSNSAEPDADSTEEVEKYKHRPKRQRKRTESVQRAIEEELEREQKRKGKGKSKPKSTKTVTSDHEEEEDDEDEEKLPEDGVLAIDKFLLKRYNTLTKQSEYLVQWNGYDIHRSAWIVKKDIFAADYLNEFEQDWLEIIKKRTENGELDVGDRVWVKLKGHQWWPAQVVVRTKPAEDKNDYTVVFYGDNTFAFVNDYTTGQFMIEKFEGNITKFRRKANEKAVKEALSMLQDEPE